MTTQRVSDVVKPALLRWARETSGLTTEETAKKIGVKPERLAEWEEGTLRPTVAQLRKAADVYKRPFAVFFLCDPPAQPVPLHDFRRLPAGTPGGSRPSCSWPCDARAGDGRWRTIS
jgi:transcriptional regulator with XRE-family HTH domain